MMTYKEFRGHVMDIKKKLGVRALLDCMQEVCGEHCISLGAVPESDYELVANAIKARMNRRVSGYAYNSTVSHAEPGKLRETTLPAAIAAPYGAEVDTTSQQVESLRPASAAKLYVGVNRTIETREDALVAIKELQQQWDISEENDTLRQLMEKMEERHGEEFNAFFEATVRQILIGTGLQQVRIDTGAVLLSIAQSSPMRVREEPGFLIYELVEDVDA